MDKTFIYKIRHKETGLFYQPVKGRFGPDKSNLSTKGQYYLSEKLSRATLKHIFSGWLRGGIRVSTSLVDKYFSNRVTTDNYKENTLFCEKKDFEIVEYELIQRKVIENGI